MSYYPLLHAPGCRGWTTLCNFAPNNWEATRASPRFINVTWCADASWQSESIGVLAPDELRTLRPRDVVEHVPEGALPLLSLTVDKLPSRSDSLPRTDETRTFVPAWRATLGLESAHVSTCYQGELDPFPAPGSLLTFCPFLQFGTEVENYVLVLNLENSPVSRVTQVEIYDSQNNELRGSFETRNNALTTIALDGLGFGPDDYPLIICRTMSAIPLYFSKASDGSFLSLEHSHPPASYVIHGRRWEAQRAIKSTWFSKVVP